MQEEDIEPIVTYFASASSEFLASMGVDINKVPEKHTWMKLLSEELNKTYEEKKLYYIVWLADNQPVGHSNIKKSSTGRKLLCIFIYEPETTEVKEGVRGSFGKRFRTTLIT